MLEEERKLRDSFGREINYLRLAVTDRCNLRCFYCMPASGIHFVDRKELLTFEEMERLIQIVSGMGLQKVRITGGEPFVRRGLMEFIERVAKSGFVEHISITTNGSLTKPHLDRLQAAGIKNINLSLDSLDRKRFEEITRRDMFEEVFDTFELMVYKGFNVKVNMVVMEGRNTEDIIPMVELARKRNVSIRFIEEMPFNGTPGLGNGTIWPATRILEHIAGIYKGIAKLPDKPGATATNYHIEGFAGDFGIIAAYTRTFCGSCNRIRVTPLGELRTCLYSLNGISIRDLLRSGLSDGEIMDRLESAVASKPRDGFAAEKERNSSPLHESMSTIGG